MVDDREEQRRQRAYALWEQEGRPDGRHDMHWQQAGDEADGHDSDHEPEATERLEAERFEADFDKASDEPDSAAITPERPLEGS
jgi:hypothetical protein